MSSLSFPLRSLIVVWLAFVSSLAIADYENVDIDLETGTTYNMLRFPAAGKSLFLVFPSERGIREGMIPIALDLAFNGHDVWAADLHASYMVPRNRASIDAFKTEDSVALIKLAKEQGFEEIFIAAQGRGAQFALRTAYAWQQETGDKDFLKGLVFSLPHLLDGRPEMGEKASYLPIARQSNLPVYMFAPEFSTKYARSREIAEQLATGGSSVFIHSLKGVLGGFQSRPVDHLSKRDLEVKAQMADILDFAMSVMRDIDAPALPEVVAKVSKRQSKKAFREPKLFPFKGDKTPPRLALEVFREPFFDLAKVKDEVILVNFWATWCGPCVEEIPSLSRLVEKLKDKPFRVITVNIGEPEDVIERFVKAIPLNFPILLDKNGEAVRDWNVYAYPSNFLIDKNGKIQYAYRGALEWDSPEIVSTIESLF